MSMDMAQIQKIKDAFTEGTITIDEVERRLEEAIDAACESDHENPGFIAACEDLLWELNTAGTQEFKSHNEQYLKAIRKKAQEKRFSLAFAAPVIKFVAVAAAVIVVVMCIVNPPTFTWLEGESTADQQQYVIRGNEITVDLIARCIAEKSEEMAKIYTSDWDEVVYFLGFAPSILDASAIGMERTDYAVFCDTIQIALYAQYYGSENTSACITFIVQWFIDNEEASYVFEQSSDGDQIEIQGTTVYASSNEMAQSYSWFDDNVVYQLTGSLSDSAILSIVEELLGE